MRSYFGVHNHTHYSNLRLVDCINRPDDLINKAIELGLSGIAITDHECLSAHMEVNKIAKKLQETNPNFTIALGNEIYLVDKIENGQKYFHFLLIAKNENGHRALRELSTLAWGNSYVDRRMERVPLLKDQLARVISQYRGNVIATTACMGGELSTLALGMQTAEDNGDMLLANTYYQKIYKFIDFCVNLFGKDFYIECAPSENKDQITVNKKLYKIAKAFDIPMVVGTDAHYLTKEDRFVHKAYLNSKDGDREVDDFYEFSRLMDSDEVIQLLSLCWEDENIIHQILNNTEEIKNKISFYSLERKQIIPKVDVKNYYPCSAWEWDFYPTIKQLLASDNIQERYWINECIKKLIDMDLDGNEEYCRRLEIEADIIKYIGEQLDDCLFAYFNTFKHYIDLFWECGSIVGPGRGSATGFLSNYLLGITQLDPIRWELPYWRFLNKERAELPSLLLILGSCKKRTLTVT